MSDNGTFLKLRANQRRAIESLAASGNVTKAAKAAGVGRTTVYRWLRAEDFCTALLEIEAARVAGLSKRLVTLTDLALTTLEGIMEDPKASGAARVRASDIILARRLQVAEYAALDERLAALEGSDDDDWKA